MEASIPVDLRNPGQVFACLGLMEAAEILLKTPCRARFAYEGAETQTSFILSVDGSDDPIGAALRFLKSATVKAIAPKDSGLSTDRWDVETIRPGEIGGASSLGDEFPCPVPDSPAALPIVLTDGRTSIAIDYWADDESLTGRDNAKFWGGSRGKPGAALADDIVELLRAVGDNVLADAARDPFSFEAPQTGSFRFDWRRDYIPLDVGFSINQHKRAIRMIGYPIVEMFAAIGLQHARPDRPERRDKLTYRYGVSCAELPAVFARAVLGAQDIGLPMRVFRMRLGWPGQEDQARCIIDAQEELAP